MANPFDTFYAFKFLYLLTQKWEDTDAFKLGIIDASGKVLRKRTTLKTDEERTAYTRFNQLVWNIKKLIEKVPLGKTTVAKYASALYLIREEFGINENDLLEHLGIEVPEISQLVLESQTDKYIQVFGLYFEDKGMGELELVSEDTTMAGIDIVDKRLNDDTDAPDESFAGSVVFTCDTHTFNRCRLGKDSKYARYKTYVGDDAVGEKIRQYGRKYPNKSIVLKNSMTGSMLYLKKK